MGHGIIVIGAGPAGLMAAGQAALSGAQVTLLEKMDRPGRKLRLAGNGRGNVANMAELEDFLAQFGANGPFLRPALARFSASQLRGFLAEIGVPTVVEPSGQVYPASNRAQDVVDALLRWVRAQGVVLHTGARVVQLLVQDQPSGRPGGPGVELVGVRTATGQVYAADAAVLATGGASYPATGSSGDGYRLAAAVGHAIVPVRPALVPLETVGDLAPRLQGLALRGVTGRLYAGEQQIAARSGDLLFTHFGLSGPAVLALSRRAVDARRAGQEVVLAIDLFPDREESALDEQLRHALDAHGRRQVGHLLASLLPRRLAAVACAEAGLDPAKRGGQVTAAERARLRRWLKGFRLAIRGPRPWSEAQVTAGGVDLREVDPRTMASRIVRGLYLAGEVLDLDAGTGGYNLQAAFATGRLAGQMAARP